MAKGKNKAIVFVDSEDTNSTPFDFSDIAKMQYAAKLGGYDHITAVDIICAFAAQITQWNDSDFHRINDYYSATYTADQAFAPRYLCGIDSIEIGDGCVSFIAPIKWNDNGSISYASKSLVYIPDFDHSLVSEITCNNLQKLRYVEGMSNLGLYEDGEDVVHVNLSSAPLLMHEAVLNIFNTIADVHFQGTDKTFKITLHAGVYGKLMAEEIAIATAKGWQVVSA